MGNKTLDMRVRTALLMHPYYDIDGVRSQVGQKYTDGELRASFIRIGAYSTEVDGEVFWNLPE